MTAISAPSLAATSIQQLKTGTPGDRLKPGEVKGSVPDAGAARDMTKTGTPGDRAKPGEVKGSGTPQPLLSSDTLSQLLSMLQQASAAA